MRRLGLPLFALALACEDPASKPGSVPSEPSVAAQTAPCTAERRGTELALRWRQVHGRLEEPMPELTSFEERSCPDERIRRRAPAGAARTLSLGFADARYGARSLMPLVMTRWLASHHEEKLEALLAPTGNSHSARFAFRSENAANDAERLLVALDQRVYKGVFYIIQYKKPHLIRKKGKFRREWLPGLLRAWFVVFDIDTSEALCSTRMVVVSDIEDAPVWLRTKADTQNRLVSELGETMLDNSQAALASISGELMIEEPEAKSHIASSLTPLR